MSIEDEQEYDGRYERVCANCGYEYSRHRAVDDACPQANDNGTYYWNSRACFVEKPAEKPAL